ncbi:MAG: adenine phosphoribosyltransferase [Bdellovibrio sp.]|nr:MAG: adenine phosphoribosyltransferase [Bdellovibrio sp.]
MTPETVKSLIKDVKDFPQEGIVFKDITPILENPVAYRSVMNFFINCLEGLKVTHIVAIESRGFILGASLAVLKELPLTLVRKPGKLPRKTISYSYDLEYGSDTLEIHSDALTSEDRVVIIDDVLATGGTAHATEELCRKAGAQVEKLLFLIELNELKGASKLQAPYNSFIQF